MTRLIALLCLCAAVETAHAQVRDFTTFVGPEAAGAGREDAIGTDARFYRPRGLAADGVGNGYIGEYLNNDVRKIDAAGVVSTVAGLAPVYGSRDGFVSAASFNRMEGVAVDATGSVMYVIAKGRLSTVIRRIILGGEVTTFAGGTTGSADGIGTSAQFREPEALAIDSAGNLWVADTGNCTIRRITPAAEVTTYAGLAGSCGTTDGTGADARFGVPAGIAVDANDELVVADTGNNLIRRIAAGAVVTTLAGSWRGSSDGNGPAASFWMPTGIAVAPDGTVYVVDERNSTIRAISPTADVTTLAGLARNAGLVDGTGAAARFQVPHGLARLSSGDLLVSELNGHVIRRVTPAGVVTTVAGATSESGTDDGVGASARLRSPHGLGADADYLYVADTDNHTIRRVTWAGDVTTLAGSGGQKGSADGVGASARFDSPRGVAADRLGNVYVADSNNLTIRRITAAGQVTTVAGVAGMGGLVDGLGPAARFLYPTAVSVGPDGDLMVADNWLIRRVTPAGLVTTVAGDLSQGHRDGQGRFARFTAPIGLAFDAAGNLYVADSDHVRKVTPQGLVTTLADSSESGPLRKAFSIAFNPAADELLVGAWGGIVSVTLDGLVTPVGGLLWYNTSTYGSSHGTGERAAFTRVDGLAVGPDGSLYTADTDASAIRIGRPPLVDRAAIDAPSGPIGDARQLDALPSTASAWSWQITRRPATSTAELSDATVRNPTFTPDIEGLWQFTVVAEGAGGRSRSAVWLDTHCSAELISQGPDAESCPGHSFGFFAVAVGSAPPKIQWYHDGVAVRGQTDNSLDIEFAIPSDAGFYHAELVFPCVTLTTAPALLTLAGGPVDRGNSLRLVKTGADLTASWATELFASSYELYQSDRKYGNFEDVTLSQPAPAASATAPMPAGDLLFFRVASALSGCGVGPLCPPPAAVVALTTVHRSQQRFDSPER